MSNWIKKKIDPYKIPVEYMASLAATMPLDSEKNLGPMTSIINRSTPEFIK